MPPVEDTVVELRLEHTFDPPADADAIKRALIYRSYSYAVEARDASSITFTKSYDANAALEALLGAKRVVARHITRFTEGGAETAVCGHVDVLGGIEFSINLTYAEGRCVGALRVQLAGLSPGIRAVTRPLLAKLMRGRFIEERRLEEETMRELSASLTPPPCASGAASTAVPSVCASPPPRATAGGSQYTRSTR